jgi:hypothetical protein
MKLLNRILFVFLMTGMGLHLNNIPVYGQSNWYVGYEGTDHQFSGSTSEFPFKTVEFAASICQPGDTINVLAGVYNNANYLDGDIWKLEKTVSLSQINGIPGADIVIRPNPGDQVVFNGDGLYIFHLRNCSFIRVEGFEIEGEVEQIPLDSALAYQFIYKDIEGEIHYRVPPGTPPEIVENMTFPVLDYAQRPTFYDTKGFVIQNSHHITVSDCHIHHMPGTGLRTNGCDYIWFIGNEINDCSRRSPSGTHALVVDSSVSIDNEEEFKFFIVGNEVHHNYNEIYSWSKNKSFITPVIDEGKGISLQRNRPVDGWTHGRILVANNITYLNGLSGVHSNNGARIDFIHNTAYYNSLTGRGNNIGISLQRNEDCRILNNITVAEPGKDGFAIAVSNSSSVIIENNLVSGNIDSDSEAIDKNTTFGDPLFENPDQWNFHLRENSPAVGKGVPIAWITDDYFGNPRDLNPDLGAVEYIFPSLIKNTTLEKVFIFPNPAINQFQLMGLNSGLPCRIFDLASNFIGELDPVFFNDKTNTATYSLPASIKSGLYFVVGDQFNLKLYVK